MPSESCPFCRIVRGESTASVVYRDEDVVAFRDIRPVAPVHILVVPTKHVTSLKDLKTEDEGLLERVLVTARKIADQVGISAGGYRLVINTGPDGGQTVFHLHVHLMGGRRMHWPPG